jgi:hypothetical protein
MFINNISRNVEKGILEARKARNLLKNKLMPRSLRERLRNESP